MTNNMTTSVTHELKSNFVKVDEIARILSLALEAEKNVLLWGPGGHGKSEMVATALSAVATEDEVFVQSFGEGMDEATLWGGLDFAALEEEKVLRYFPENSFLESRYAVFEEIFDAPAQVLLALKDCLTAKKLRKGNQVHAMRTKVIVACTNKDPREIADLGPAAAALIERFPLQLKVEWGSYKGGDYLELFQKVAPKKGWPNDSYESLGILAEVFGQVAEKGEVISPRTACHALDVVSGAARLRGSDQIEQRDLLDLKFLPGLEEYASSLEEELEAAYERAQAEKKLTEAEERLGELLEEFEGAETPIKLLQSAKRLTEFSSEVGSLKATDQNTQRRDALRDKASSAACQAQQKALESTRV